MFPINLELIFIDTLIEPSFTTVPLLGVRCGFYKGLWVPVGFCRIPMISVGFYMLQRVQMDSISVSIDSQKVHKSLQGLHNCKIYQKIRSKESKRYKILGTLNTLNLETN